MLKNKMNNKNSSVCIRNENVSRLKDGETTAKQRVSDSQNASYRGGNTFYFHSAKIRTEALHAGFTSSDVGSGYVFKYKDSMPVYIPYDIASSQNKQNIKDYLLNWTNKNIAEKLSDIISKNGSRNISSLNYKNIENKKYLDGTFQQAYIKSEKFKNKSIQTLYSYNVPVFQVCDGKAQFLMNDISDSTMKHIKKYAELNQINLESVNVRQTDPSKIKKQKNIINQLIKEGKEI